MNRYQELNIQITWQWIRVQGLTLTFCCCLFWLPSSLLMIFYTNIDQKLVNSLHWLFNCEIVGLDCHIITPEYRTRVHCIHLFCNAFIHVIYTVLIELWIFVVVGSWSRALGNVEYRAGIQVFVYRGLSHKEIFKVRQKLLIKKITLKELMTNITCHRVIGD